MIDWVINNMIDWVINNGWELIFLAIAVYHIRLIELVGKCLDLFGLQFLKYDQILQSINSNAVDIDREINQGVRTLSAIERQTESAGPIASEFNLDELENALSDINRSVSSLANDMGNMEKQLIVIRRHFYKTSREQEERIVDEDERILTGNIVT